MMSAINQYLFDLTRTERVWFYQAFGNAIFPVMGVQFIWAVIVKDYKFKKAAAIFVSFAVSYYLRMYICTWLNQITDGLFPDRNLGAAFLPFLSVFCLLVLLFRVPVAEGLDVAVPMYIGGRGVAIIGCIFAGCCQGHYASWGIYSENVGYNTVPCHVIDILVSVLLAVSLICFSKRLGVRGKPAAYGLAVFGALRYIIDVLRDNDKIYDLITLEGICGFIYLCIGLCMLYFIGQKQDVKQNSLIPALSRDI